MFPLFISIQQIRTAHADPAAQVLRGCVVAEPATRPYDRLLGVHGADGVVRRVDRHRAVRARVHREKEPAAHGGGGEWDAHGIWFGAD